MYSKPRWAPDELVLELLQATMDYRESRTIKLSSPVDAAWSEIGEISDRKFPYLTTMPPRKKNTRKLSHEPGNARQPLSKAQLAGLAEKIQIKFNWKHTPHLYQLEAIEGQLQMRDTLVHAGTGAGKTTIAAGPHAHESSAG
jgi:hypothetical protein